MGVINYTLLSCRSQSVEGSQQVHIEVAYQNYFYFLWNTFELAYTSNKSKIYVYLLYLIRPSCETFSIRIPVHSILNP